MDTPPDPAETEAEPDPASPAEPARTSPPAPGAPAAAEPVGTSSPEPYRVLARKYRPASFDELIGQEAMVRTLRNAFASGRIAQAYMLTGVRGVGKTTTARILARALNYQTDAVDRPSVDFEDGEGVHDRAILEGRHPDVVEMDAASHTGVDNMRDVLASLQYAPVSARYKVYVIDEVHMLSSGAFNAMLKTLEEPPRHVKFVLATTEIRKVPVTVLSRCQRFDLRRVPVDQLAAHLSMVAGREGASVEEDALAALVRASEGSVRDALSLLDQAIGRAMTGDGASAVTGAIVRDMLGLADRARVIDLFDAVMRGDVAAALTEFAGQYEAGAAPIAVLTDLAAHTHLVSRLKFAPTARDDPGLTPDERERGPKQAQALSTGVLARAWQMLLKGIEECERSPHPDRAAEMVLIRLAHAADLPGPGEALAMLGGSAATAAASAPATNGGAMGGGAMSGSARVLAFAGGGAARQLRAPEDDALDAAPVGRIETFPDAGPSGTGAEATMRAPGDGSGPPRGPGGAGRPHLSLVPPPVGPPDETEPAEPASPSDPAADAERIDAAPDPALLDPGTVLAALHAAATDRRDIRLVTAFRKHLRLVALDASDPSRPVITLASDAPTSRRFCVDMAASLQEWTGLAWDVRLGEGGGPTLTEMEEAARDARLDDAARDPDVAAILKAFPGARVTDVRPREGVRAAPEEAFGDAFGEAFEDAPFDPDAGDPDDPDDDPDD